jgi:molecular chaperone GrpE
VADRRSGPAQDHASHRTDRVPLSEEDNGRAASDLLSSPEPDKARADPPTAEAAPAAQEQLARALADLDNLRKRYRRELEREREAERMRGAAAWLPVVDDLERALSHADGEDSPVVAGLRAVLDEANDLLSQLGFPRFEDIGERFDARRHEALSAIADDGPTGIVLEALRPGYGNEEVVLRPAGVVVSLGRS